MISFDQCDLTINDIGFVAENVTLDADNSIIQLLTLGRRGAGSAVAGAPLKTQLSLEYPIRTKNDPNFEAIFNLKQGNLPYFTINFGGIWGVFYLTDLSLSAQPNQLLKARATYATFAELNGNLRESDGTVTYPDNTYVGHSWTTTLNLSDNASVVKGYDFDYSFNISLAPQFILGQRNPSQVVFLGATEKLVLTTEDYYSISPYGEKAKIRLANAVSDNSIAMIGISFLEETREPDLVVNLKESIITTSSIAATVDGPLKIRTTISREY